VQRSKTFVCLLLHSKKQANKGDLEDTQAQTKGRLEVSNAIEGVKRLL
jgi:hypothetical protein